MFLVRIFPIAIIIWLSKNLINIAPFPVFTAFKRPYYGVSSLVKMFCCMFVYRRIATAYVTAEQAKTQMHPCRANLFAFLATLCSALNILVCLPNMTAFRVFHLAWLLITGFYYHVLVWNLNYKNSTVISNIVGNWMILEADFEYVANKSILE
jgi:hypothetical protein